MTSPAVENGKACLKVRRDAQLSRVPLFTRAGLGTLHTPADSAIDVLPGESGARPKAYTDCLPFERTLWSHQKGGFSSWDGRRSQPLKDVVEPYIQYYSLRVKRARQRASWWSILLIAVESRGRADVGGRCCSAMKKYPIGSLLAGAVYDRATIWTKTSRVIDAPPARTSRQNGF
jgi:hypothetical protein